MKLQFAAGSDTSASLERAASYYILQNPKALKRLQIEVDAAIASSLLNLKTSNNSYFDVVIKQSLRIHSPVGVSLERVVPRSGLQLQDSRRISPWNHCWGERIGPYSRSKHLRLRC